MHPLIHYKTEHYKTEHRAPEAPWCDSLGCGCGKGRGSLFSGGARAPRPAGGKRASSASRCTWTKTDPKAYSRSISAVVLEDAETIAIQTLAVKQGDVLGPQLYLFHGIGR